MWKQWRHFFVTVASLLALMYLVSTSEAATNAIHSLAEWIVVKLTADSS